MIKDNQVHLNRAHVIVDGLIIAGSYIASYFIIKDPTIGQYSQEEYFRYLYYVVPAYLFLYYLMQLYTSRRALKLWDEFVDIFEANVLGVLGLYVLLFWISKVEYSRRLTVIFFAINVAATTIAHGILRKFLQFIRKKGYNIKHILLVGYSRAAEGYISRILDNPQWGYVIAGVLDDFVPIGTSYHGIEVIGNTDKLASYLENNQFDEITITLPLNDYDRLEEFVAQCEKSGVHTKFIPDYSSLFPSNPYTEDVQGIPVINIRYVPLTNSFNRLAKRMVDIIGSLIGIILCSPVMFVVAFLIKSTDNGPILFKQERVGLNGKTFNMYKFRSMRVQTESEEKKGWTTKDDPRVTTIGKFIRKTSIDELPQLFNILIGQMSIVGPRPERPQFVEKFKEEIPRYMVKHQVRPGLTGWAQINGYRGDTSIRKRIEYDLYYIENWSMMFDFRIIIGTIRYGIVNKNAY
ncbi:undecaprenyl-phosphate glucose phosphotransferase [Butyrivibrio hungatei]|uniref:undecaprenyl-phosphate glucose phosphotransferase n=1 Tax=Butyrivibrio hungatei TaxID=185008 RepID=UPI0004185CD2|nr:undecaprenyl-phosphate glucose phosphotransferase [Butyrivibrio hungatei]